MNQVRDQGVAIILPTSSAEGASAISKAKIGSHLLSHCPGEVESIQLKLTAVSLFLGKAAFLNSHLVV